jgi:hypothetical protein
MLTFKQYLREEREPPKCFTVDEFDALPAPSASNINSCYKVGKVAFDNKHGFGATPNNQEVNYFGFAASMTPSVFLRFAAAGDREDAGVKFTRFIQDHAPMGAPTLYISTNWQEFKEGKPLKVEVIGHEGRGRMIAIQKVNGSMEKIPVHFIPRDGARARHLSPEFFEALRDTGMSPEKSSRVSDAHLGKIYWNGKMLS